MLKQLLPYFLLIIGLFMAHPLYAHLPEGFVYVLDIDPSIVEDLRYARDENFIGRPIAGYKSNKAILTKEAALALRNVQAELAKDGYTIVIYDAYRPVKAVKDFKKWSQNSADQKNKNLYYPRIDKAQFFELGYLIDQSSHSRGSTVDISIIKNPEHYRHNPTKVTERLTDNEVFVRLDDGTVDMGSAFDFMDEVSHHDSPLVSKEVTERRNYLRNIMKAHGFKEYSEEWWHYTLVKEPFPEQYFDFDVR